MVSQLLSFDDTQISRQQTGNNHSGRHTAARLSIDNQKCELNRICDALFFRLG